ncbi:divergent polysaccharide deacetylase family protein [Deferribacteres bacterium DY0037]
MNNRKNGSGKRVRTPITTSGSNNNNNGNKNRKETKVTTLMMAGGLAVLAVMLFAVAFLFMARGSSGNVDPAQGAPETVRKQITNEQVLDAVYVSLFTYGLDKSSIKEQTEVESDGKTEIKMTIDPQDIEETELKQTLTEKLNELGLEVTGDEVVSVENSTIKLDLQFSKPKAVLKPKPNSIAFVIDDCGYSEELAEKLAAFPYPMTMAIIPHTEYAKKTAEIAYKAGKVVFLHQPMQPLSYPKTDPGKGAVLLNMPEKIIQTSLDSNVASLGGKIDGFNNHMGSAITQDREKMKQVFKVMKKYTDTFLDSYTSRDTVAFDQCKAEGMKCAINRKFIDNESDYSYIRSKIIEGAEIARTDGSVIMIGHLRESTVHALEKILPELEKAGYNIVPVTELTQK